MLESDLKKAINTHPIWQRILDLERLNAEKDQRYLCGFSIYTPATLILNDHRTRAVVE